MCKLEFNYFVIEMVLLKICLLNIIILEDKGGREVGRVYKVCLLKIIIIGNLSNFFFNRRY